MLLRRCIAPLTTLPPLVLGRRRRAKQHRLGRRRTHAIARDAAARASLVQASLTEDARQRYAEFLVHGEITAQQSNLSVFTLVSIHRAIAVAILLVVTCRLTAAFVMFSAMIVVADRLTIVRVTMIIISAIGAMSGVLVRVLRYLPTAERPALQ